jgi:hypothetical protein
MMRRLLGVLGCLLAVSPALATLPGERLSADDLVFTVFGLTAATYVPVDPEFDYAACGSFPTPADLRCDLLAQNGFDAEGKQYAIRLGHSLVNPLLPRTEIWRTRFDGTTEMIAYLDPRPAPGGTFDDGRIEKLAVDAVSGTLYGVLNTGCFPTNAPACLYQGRANEIIKITGLKLLRDVLLMGSEPTPTNGGGSTPPIGQNALSRTTGDTAPERPAGGSHR